MRLVLQTLFKLAFLSFEIVEAVEQRRTISMWLALGLAAHVADIALRLRHAGRR